MKIRYNEPWPVKHNCLRKEAYAAMFKLMHSDCESVTLKDLDIRGIRYVNVPTRYAGYIYVYQKNWRMTICKFKKGLSMSKR